MSTATAQTSRSAGSKSLASSVCHSYHAALNPCLTVLLNPMLSTLPLHFKRYTHYHSTLWLKFLSCFLCSPWLHLFDQNTIKTVMLWILHFKITVFNFYIFKIKNISSVGKAEFFSFSVTWSFRNYSNMLIWCSRNISYYQCWKQLIYLIFLCKLWYSLFQNRWIQSSKHHYFIWYINLNVKQLYCGFNKCNASLNKSNHYFKHII